MAGITRDLLQQSAVLDNRLLKLLEAVAEMKHGFF
jgi:hypothetical protein